MHLQPPRRRGLAKLLLPGLLACCLSALGMLAGLAGPDVAAARSHGPTVYSALQSLERSSEPNSEAAAAYAADSATYGAALSAVKKLSGTRRSELSSVIANVQQIAAAGGFIASRLPALFLTLENNLTWWTTKPLLAADQRVSMPPSRIVWEYYPGQGIEIQWLATFGEANGYYLQGHENTQLQEVLNEVLPLATLRAGGIAWEYMFHFDGGSPPWTSGLSQGTALQAFSRAWSRLKTPAYLTAAKQALGLFQTPPPSGVRVATPAGATYLEYTYAPKERIINGFIQSLNGLYDYAKLTGDPLGLALFQAGDAEARAEVPHYDTGSWSLYDQHSESNLNYHELLAEFLEDLCQRTNGGPPVPTPPATTTPPAPPSPAPTPTPPPTTTTATTPTGGASATASRASASRASTGQAGVGKAAATTVTPAPTPIPGDAIYCTTAERFTADLHTPPAIALLTGKLPARARGGVQLSLSKIATVSLSVSQGGHLVWANSALVERGKPRLLWITPAKSGVYSVTLRAVDLAGNSSSASGTITVTAAAKHTSHHH